MSITINHQTNDISIAGGGSPTLGGAAANLIDDYEEGTWTGALTPLTSGSITMHATITTGSYTKVGNKVTITGTFNASSVSSPVGRLRITGLPFSAKTGTSGDAAVALRIYGAVDTTAVNAAIANAGNFIDFYPFNTTDDTYAAKIQAGTTIEINVTYIT